MVGQKLQQGVYFLPVASLITSDDGAFQKESAPDYNPSFTKSCFNENKVKNTKAAVLKCQSEFTGKHLFHFKSTYFQE